MIELPKRFVSKINNDKEGNLKGAAYLTQSKFKQVFEENDLYFFLEYTDHGWRHINSVLKSCNELIPVNTFKLLGEKDIVILILGVFLHDLGMHLQPLTFKAMVTGEYDDVLSEEFEDTPWQILWQSYLEEAKKFNDQQRLNIFGDATIDVKEPDLNKIGSLTIPDRKLIGEFIRRHHPRIASEVVFKGVKTNSGQYLDFFADFDTDYRLLAGILARSHGMNVRDTFKVLKVRYDKLWNRPFNVHIVYLMALLRLADYFQVDTGRVLKIPFHTKLFQSPLSFTEHQKHLQTKSAQPLDDNPEVLFILAEPISSKYFLALESLYSAIQKELDSTWAILGEVYGARPYNKQPKLIYRRIQSNLEDMEHCAQFKYVTERMAFSVDREIPKLLVAPLYKDNPSCGIRELIQNAADACKEREFLERRNGNTNFKGKIKVKIDRIDEGSLLFSIQDNGKGMILQEIKDYFLKIGGSFRKSAQWQTNYLDQGGHSLVSKSGRFGIGVLAAYLLGPEINVVTKSMHANVGYELNTKLDEEQIEVKKIYNELELGTTITIQISQSVLKKLLSKKMFKLDREIVSFFEWYVLTDIDITYEVNGENIHPMVRSAFLEAPESATDNYQEIKDEAFKHIFWTYHGADQFAQTIICNGIVIPRQYRLDTFVAPTLIVSDFDAKLPLSLDRNSLTADVPFAKTLIWDISKDILAKLLTFDVINLFGKIIEKNGFLTSFEHKAFQRDYDSFLNFNRLRYVVYSRSGFTLDSSVFLNRFIGKLHYRVGLDNFSSVQEQLEIIIPKADLVTFYAPFENWQNTSGETANAIRANLGRLNGKFIKWSSNYNSFVSERWSVDSDKYDVGLKDFIIEEINFSDKSESMVFNQVVKEYMGNDVLIPYRMEDRIAKFPKAFKELDKYMRKYRL